MSVEVQSTGTNAPPVETPAADSPEAKSDANIAKYAKQAAEAALKSADTETSALETARGESEDGEKPRGPDGKFLPAKKANDGKAKTEKATPKAAKQATSAKPDAADAAKSGEQGGKSVDGGVDEGGIQLSGGLGKAKRLVREGKIAEALKLIDVDPEKIPGGQWAAWRKENAKEAAKLRAREQDIVTAHEQVKSEARELVSQLRPFAEAKQAIESGDEDAAFQLMFGKSVDEWQRERLARMHRGDLRKDPVVSEFAKKLEAEKAERLKLQKLLEERDVQAQQREEQAAIEKRQGEYREELKGQLSDSGDARLARAAELPWFVKMVHQEQLDSYKFDPRTQHEDYLTVEEAIERVYDPERLTAAQWRQLTGEHNSPEKRDPGTQNQVASDRRGSDVKRVAKAPLTLSRSEAADPTPRPTMDTEQRIAYYSNLHARNLMSGG